MKDPAAKLDDTLRAVSKSFETPRLNALIDAHRLPLGQFKQLEEFAQKATRQWAEATRTLSLPVWQSLQPLAQMQAVADALSSAMPSLDWLSPDPNLALMSRYAERTAAHFDAIVRNTTFLSPAVLTELERLRSIIEEHRAAIVDAADEPTRRLTLTATLRAVFKGTTGIDTQLNSPEEVLAFWIGVVRFVVMLLWPIYSGHLASLEVSRERQDHRRIEQALAETTATFVETVRQQIQEHVPDIQNAPQVRLCVKHRGFLREGPSSTTHRILTLKAGQRLKLLATVERWYYVEGNSDEQDAVTRGWVYRRNVRVVSR